VTPLAGVAREAAAFQPPAAEAALAGLEVATYERLRALARELVRRHRHRSGAGASSLVHEACLRLARSDGPSASDDAHFLRTAARAMRFVLVDQLRRRTAAKRGGTARPAAPADPALLPARPEQELLALDDALGRLAAIDPMKAEVVELRFFGGLSVEETAASLGVSPATIKRDWALARAWLFRELGGE
jgi:RNA polymerase sigma factor (TIGR02999 family)